MGVRTVLVGALMVILVSVFTGTLRKYAKFKLSSITKNILELHHIILVHKLN